jgi:LysR family transcriptional regulator of gallate degradation
LALTQPTLTKAIHGLERELGVQLFERLPRGVDLTPYGQSLLRHAEALHVQTQEALSEIEGLRDGAIGDVAIGAEPAWLGGYLPLAIARTIATKPGVKVRVDSGYDGALLTSLRRGEVDFILTEIPDSKPVKDLDIERLASDSLGVCCRAEHPLAKHRSVAMKQLLDYLWIMPSRSSHVRRRLRALFIAAGLPTPEMVVETDSKTFLLQMLRNSDSLTFTVQAPLSEEDAGLVMLRVEGICATRETGIITRRGAWLSPTASAIISELKSICAAAPGN